MILEGERGGGWFGRFEEGEKGKGGICIYIAGFTRF